MPQEIWGNYCRGPPSVVLVSKLTLAPFGVMHSVCFASWKELGAGRTRVSVPPACQKRLWEGDKASLIQRHVKCAQPSSPPDLISSPRLHYLCGFFPSFTTWGMGQEEGSGVGAPLCLVYDRSPLQAGHRCPLQPGVSSPEPWAGLAVETLMLVRLCIAHRRIRMSPWRVPWQGNGSKVLGGQRIIMG